ncbi:MAG TPA: anthranilate phosphoribosyltransferase [Syntrophaceae bacterium]|nr:anthranilate phosphoribosyltransferase [Syntrophaceae bacterium]
MVIKDMVKKVAAGLNLSEPEMISVMEEIMEGRTTSAQIGAFLTALRMKGETIDEITGAAKVMRSKALKVDGGWEVLIDTCGTGGDNSGTFNVSTTVAFVVAGAGLKVAKHGNRSVSSLCGSADVMEALGVTIDVGPEVVERCIKEIGIGFLYAPRFHSAMRYAKGPRTEIGIRTIFNILGPLTNPAGANVQVLGVYEPSLTDTLAYVLKNLGSKGALVVYGEGNFDEITITGKTKVSQLKEGEVFSYYVEPKDFGLQRAMVDHIRGGDSRINAQIVLSILKGETGAKRDMTLLNAAAAFLAADVVRDLKEGVEMARESIDSGKAMQKLNHLVQMTRGQIDTR